MFKHITSKPFVVIIFIGFFLLTVAYIPQITNLSAATITDTITVTPTTVLNTISPDNLGINTSFMTDDDTGKNRPKSTAQIMNEMGVKHFRYPGGEESDSVLWSTAPYASASPITTRTGPNEWPANDSRYTLSDNKTYNSGVLDFDEFMTLMSQVGGKPNIVVAEDAQYKAASANGTIPTKQQLVTNATEWVRYANKVKNYNISNWEIGNEAYINSYNGTTDATTYAGDVSAFSKAMKAVDSSIKIGANGGDLTWWQTVLKKSYADIDFLSVHVYLPYGVLTDYASYHDQNISLIPDVTTAISAINKYVPVASRSKINIAVTEFNSADWTGVWPITNTIGHAVLTFDQIGQLLKQPKVLYSQLWTLRWINNGSTPAELWDAVDQNGNLNPSGKVLSLWSAYLLPQLVTSTNTTYVRSYSVYDSATKKLNVFLINKEYEPRTTKVKFSGFTAGSVTEFSTYAGTNVDDLNPVFTKNANPALVSNTATVTIPGVSVSILTFQGK